MIVDSALFVMPVFCWYQGLSPHSGSPHLMRLATDKNSSCHPSFVFSSAPSYSYHVLLILHSVVAVAVSILLPAACDRGRLVNRRMVPHGV